MYTLQEISNQERKLRNHIVLLKLTNTPVNLSNKKQDWPSKSIASVAHFSAGHGKASNNASRSGWSGKQGQTSTD